MLVYLCYTNGEYLCLVAALQQLTVPMQSPETLINSLISAKAGTGRKVVLEEANNTRSISVYSKFSDNYVTLQAQLIIE